MDTRSRGHIIYKISGQTAVRPRHSARHPIPIGSCHRLPAAAFSACHPRPRHQDESLVPLLFLQLRKSYQNSLYWRLLQHILYLLSFLFMFLQSMAKSLAWKWICRIEVPQPSGSSNYKSGYRAALPVSVEPPASE